MRDAPAVLAPPPSTAAALDPDQQRAVAHRDGPCLVLAGPGSGKTRVIVERFLSLCRSGIPPSAQLVLTYTRRAAEEMRARAETMHGPFDGETPLTNYHSFAYRVVRDWGWLLGVSPAVRIADAAERWLHAEAVLDELRPRTLWNPLRPFEMMDALLGVIATAKQELVTPDAYSHWAAQRLGSCDDPAERAVLERHCDVAAVYARLDERYRRLGVFDHDDCILYAERLLRDHPAAQQAVAGRISHVMVDEYQDTNYSQARLVETMVQSHRNLLVVADDDQSIYKFRGASRANLDRFEREYPEHVTVVLTHNYRSTPQIVAAARAIIGGAGPGSRIDKDLVAERSGGTPVEVWSAPDQRSEMQAVAEECRRLVDSGTRASTIAWLFRRHVDMQPAMDALRRAGVAYQVSGGRGYFQQREVKDMLALLTAAAEPDDSMALLRCLSLPAWRLQNRLRHTLAVAGRDHDAPLATLIADGVATIDEDSLGPARACLEEILALHALCEREDVREVFWEALQRSGFLGILDEQQPAARMQMAANINKFGELLESFADWSDDRRVVTALRYLEVLRDSHAASELAPIEAIEDGVVLLTAHGAKGLEWPVVFLADCVKDEWCGRAQSVGDLQLPDALVPEPPPFGEGPVDEERRLFYVAATRARDRLVFTWSQRQPRRYAEQLETPFIGPLDGCAHPPQRTRIDSLHAVAARPRRRTGAPLPVHPSLSVSDLRTFKACPRQFEYAKIWGLPSRDSTQSWYGSMVHDVLRTAAVQRSSGVAVDADAVAALWQDAWRTSRGPKAARPELRDLGRQQLRAYIASPAWTESRIEAVEETISMEISGAEIVGRLDRVDARDDDGHTVVDYKTSRPREASRVASDMQVRAYALATSRRIGRDDVSVELHYLQTGEVARVDFGADELARAFRHLSATTDEIARAWRAGVFPPRPSAFTCPRCPFRMVCDEGAVALAAG